MKNIAKENVNMGEKIKRKHYFIFFAGGFAALLLLGLVLKGFQYTSSNEFCMLCHVHSETDAAFFLSPHNSNRSGVSAKCVECHLPPIEKPFKHVTRKAYHGFHDLYYYLVKDMDEIDWEAKRTVEASKRFIYEESCLKCHTNLFPAQLDETGAEQHLKYIEDPKNNSCMKCHLEVGHYRGEYKLEAETEDIPSDELFAEPAVVTAFEDFTEMIPGTVVSFNMKAIPGGTFKMGSSENEQYRRADEGPVRDVELNNFWMGEIEVTWNEYLAFFHATGSQGRKEAEAPEDEDPDVITGATPPWGAPDQGWGMKDRPAITMTHHAAQTYCRWLSIVTGKKYRLPTEAEWEYAARGGTSGAYFFEGSPKNFEKDGLWNKIFGPDTAVINTYVIYHENSPFRTQPPSAVGSNPFGLKNMLGNVAEFCLDFYDPQVYGKYPQGVVKNPRGPREGLEHVIRGGSFKNSAADLRIARRDFTRTREWLETDPQIPKSIWWYSDCNHVGFRVVCEYSSEEVNL